MASVMILVLLTLYLGICWQFVVVEGLPLVGDRNVVYTRYVRRRPMPFSNNYVREVIEVFNTQRRPPPYAFLHDEDLTRFVRCDFDPTMADCDEETQSATTTPAQRTLNSTPRAQIDVFSKPLTSSTTSRSSFLWERRSEITTTTTEQNIKVTESDEELPSAALSEPQEATVIPKSPIVSEEYRDENSEGENGNEYDDAENNKEGKSTDTDDSNETEYYDEVEKGENNSEDVAESSDFLLMLKSRLKQKRQQLENFSLNGYKVKT